MKSMRTIVNSKDWLRDLFLGHLLLFLTAGLFQLFLFSFPGEGRDFRWHLCSYAGGGIVFLLLWWYRRKYLRRGDHWILRTGWWDLFPIVIPPLAGCLWHALVQRDFCQERVLGGILMTLSIALEIREVFRMDSRLTTAFIARLRRVRGAEGAYLANRVNYRGWCLTFAWIMLSMLLYNGGGDYARISWTSHILRLSFLVFSICVLWAVAWNVLFRDYWQRSRLALQSEDSFRARLWKFLRNFPWSGWLAIPALALVVQTAFFFGRDGWYLTVMLAIAHQLLVCNFMHHATGRPSRLWGWLVIHPVYLLVVSFLVLVLVGTFLFELPFCYLPVSASPPAGIAESVGTMGGYGGAGQGALVAPMPLIDAFFTSASAVCVTGMTTVDVASFPIWGRVVLCCLIQLGALGVMTISSFFAVLTGQRLGLMGNSLVSRVAGEDRGLLAKRMIRMVVLVTLWLEVLGTGVFFLYLHCHLGMGAWAAFGHGFFLALNSFCNAGFQIYPGGFTVAGLNATVPMLTAAMLFILGGLGFGVLTSIWRRLFHDHVRAQSPQVRIVLWMTVLLLFGGTLLLLLSEWNNPATLGEMTPPKKVLNAFFATASSRTAGYEALPLQRMNAPASMATRVLVFIGGAPGSTGGGIRVTTIGVLLLLLWSIVRRRQDVVVGKAMISQSTVRQAIAVLCLGLLVATCGTLLLTFATMGTGITLGQLSFEVVSAMSTVGMSLGVTAQLNAFGKAVLIVIMFLGRVGFLTVLSAASGTAAAPKVRYPEWRVMIG